MPHRIILAGALLCALAPPAWSGERGIASYFGVGDGLHGHLTACGAPLNAYAMVAAHPSYRCGKQLRVINLANHREVTVRVVDYGPAAYTGRIIDLSYGAAKALGFVKAGTAKVLVIPLR